MSIKTALKTEATLTQTSALALATGLIFAAAPAHAQSFEGTGVVVEGGATITTGTGTTDVTVNTPSAVIDWTPFDSQGFGDILFQPAGTTATFTNDPQLPDFAVLNRILPFDPNRRIIFDGTVISQLQDGLGNVSPGGTVFFYTPGGIVIGANAVFDVGNLGLTTSMPVTDGAGNFMDPGGTVFFAGSDPFAAVEIQPGAQINALSEGSYVAAFAPQISNAGDIRVNGQAALVAGEAGSITFSPDGLFDIQVDVGTDSSSAFQNSGSITGPASTGLGDNHRIYIVAVPKNNAITMLFEAGSDLGFDIAQSASQEGETIVLSGGFDIIVGDIDPLSASPFEASMSFSDGSPGPSNAQLYTSDVVARATGGINMFAASGGTFSFNGDATFAAGNIDFFFSDFGLGPSSLQVDGDLSLFADRPAFGADAGNVALTFDQGSGGLIGGSLNLSTDAQFDSNEDGEVRGGVAELAVQNGAFLAVANDLNIRASVDQSGGPADLNVLSDFAGVSLSGGATLDVGGVTRLRTDAVAATGGDARAGFSILTIDDSTFTTGELNITADAFAGDDAIGGTGPGNAQGGDAQINVTGPAASLTVLAGNATGSAANGELEFLSSEAYGGQGVEANGGSATGGSVALNISGGASVSLPADALAPLVIRTVAVGGDTFEDDGAGGTAQSGFIGLSVADSAVDLGLLSIFSQARGGSGLAGSERTSGGAATNGNAFIDFTNSTVDVAFEQLFFEQIGGAGSESDLSIGGDANGGNVTFRVENSALNVLSDLNIFTFTQGGAGRTGGFATGTSSNPDFINSTVTVAGNLRVDQNVEGGFGESNGINAAPAIGGDAVGQFGGILFQGSDVTTTGTIATSQIVFGGDVRTGNGGNADSFDTVINLDGFNTITAPLVEARSTAIGGSNLEPGTGNGGMAISRGARIDVPNFGNGASGQTTAISGNVSAITNATGGAAGSDGGDGGAANSGFARLALFDTMDLSIGGNFVATTQALGGIAPGGLGGAATSNVAEIFSFADGGVINIAGDASLTVNLTGGSGQDGGSANSGRARLLMQGTTLDIGGLTFIEVSHFGGLALDNANPGRGGIASGGGVDVIARNNEGGTDTLINLADLAIDLVTIGGNGGNSTGGSDGGNGGNAVGPDGLVFGQAINGTLQVTGSTEVSLLTIGGRGGDGANGGLGGDATGGFVQLGTASGGPVAVAPQGAAIFGSVDMSATNIGGDGGIASNGTGGAGGVASGGSFTLLGRGAEVRATTVSMATNAAGGDGGSGTTQGGGGDANAGTLSLVVSQAFQNNGRGSLDLGSVLMNSGATGGAGSSQGASNYGNGGQISITQSDAVIGSIDVNYGGLTADPNAMTTFPFTVNFSDAVVDLGTFDLVTPGDAELRLDGSIVTGSGFSILAGAILPGAAEVLAGPNSLTMSESISLTSTLGDVSTTAPLVSAGSITVTSAGTIMLDTAAAPDITLTAQNGTIDATFLDASGGTLTLDASGVLLLPDLAAGSLIATAAGLGASGPVSVTGSVVLTSLGTATLGDIDAASITLTSEQDLSVANLTADAISLTSNTGAIQAGTLNANAGPLTLQSAGDLALADITAGSLVAISTAGNITSANPLAITGDAVFGADLNVLLADIDAGRIEITSGALVNVNGVWQAGEVVVTSANFGVDPGQSISANSIDITSTNLAGTLLGTDIAGGFTGNAISEEAFASLNAPVISITAQGVAEGGNILTVGDIDLSANGTVQQLDLGASGQSATGSLVVNGRLGADASTGPVSLGLSAGTITIDTTTGGIDLFDNGGLLSIFADRIFVGEAALFDTLTGDETEEELAALINAPAGAEPGEGGLRASEIVVTVGETFLIQNAGSEEAPAGFTVFDVDSLTVDPVEGSQPLVIINGRLDNGVDPAITGDDAATALLATVDDISLFKSGSQLNGCPITGCAAVQTGEGEVTAVVSAAISGAVTTTGSGTGTGSSTGSDDSGGSTASSGGGSTAGTGSSGSGSGGEISVDDIDDVGSDDDFVIDDDDTPAEGSGEEGDSGDEAGEETEEEEVTEEEEEEAEAAATGPIAPPVTIFNTDSLDRPVNISDPISGSGNPALTDPDVDTPPAGGNGDPQ